MLSFQFAVNKNISVLSYSQFPSFIKCDCWAFTLEHPVTADFQYIKKSLSREYNGNGYLSIPRLFLRALIRSCLSFSLASFSARSCASLKEKSCFTFSVKSLATAYLRDLRMSVAEKLLVETKLPISEIASQVGYTKQGKFAEAFRQQFQMNPLEYRRKQKLKDISTDIYGILWNKALRDRAAMDSKKFRLCHEICRLIVESDF